MLQRVEAEIGELGGFGVAVDAEDAAFFAELVEHARHCRLVIHAFDRRRPHRSRRRQRARRRSPAPIASTAIGDALAAGLADHLRRHAAACAAASRAASRRSRRRRHHDARRRLAKQRGVHLNGRRTSPTGDRSTPDADAAGVEQHSASATARPPSAQSCADSTSPRDGRDDQRAAAPALAIEVQGGGLPATTPCRTARYSLPPSSPRLSPSSTTRAPAD